jgi:pyruvate/2-oxoglutarate/acetoin dehydrogenase E1 component
VIRTEGGAGRAIAAHHSQSLESLWTHFPGIYVVMPATPYDVKGLLKAAIRDDNPVMFIEHKMLYKTKGRVPEGDYMIPLGIADIKRPGKDITLVTYSRQVLNALEAAKNLAEEGIEVEVVDLRSLKPLDTDTIVKSVRKTGRFVGVTEAYENTSFINEVMAVVNDKAFDWLDAPMVRVAAANVPVPRAEILEDLAIPNVNRIVEACRKVMS